MSAQAPGAPRDQRQAHALGPLPHELLAAQIGPGLLKTAARAAHAVRQRAGWTPVQTVHPKELQQIDSVQELLEGFGRLRYHQGATEEEAYDDANWLGQHLFYLLNYELHYRKTFWVDASLAWMLRQTRLDIDGGALELPFPSYAVAFTDGGTRELVERLIAADPSATTGPAVGSVAAYVTRLGEEHGGVGINISLLAGRGDRAWPYLVSRDLLVRRSDDLEALLDSHFPEVDAKGLDGVFRAPELKSLVQLVVNATLYATSYPEKWPVLGSPIKELRRSARALGQKRAARLEKRAVALASTRSTEDVFHLPGKIPISQLRMLEPLEHSASGRQILARYMVRGHWRRAPESWSDLRPRWIAPYWKGPEMAAVIEREYQLKP